MTWSFKAILDTVKATVPDSAAALIHADTVRTWGDLHRRSDSLAGALTARGVSPGAKVAHYMRNRPEYLETTVACFKAGFTPVNVNYRYTAHELLHIFDNSDAAVIVYDGAFAENVAALRARLSKVQVFVELDAEDPQNLFAHAYESFAASTEPAPDYPGSDDDLVFIYTGGTTGLPKGVMWRQGDLWTALGAGSPAAGMPAPATLEAFADLMRNGAGGQTVLVCPPLMHGAGYLVALSSLLRGGCVITVPGVAFDAPAALRAIAAHQARAAVIVGDAFARPIVKALQDAPGVYDISSLMIMVSSGAVWSPDVKAAIGLHNPSMMLMDSLGSSEVLGMGASVTMGDGAKSQPPRFQRDANTRVITDDGRDVEPGSGEIGRIHRGGPAPIGYYKDPDKSARTFVTLDGKRYVVPGDYATVEADGAISLIGRGSQVINTGGEKVFVEEVEAALKTFPGIADALVFGMPDPTWGQAVTAVIEASQPVDVAALRAHLRTTLADFKTPKRLFQVDRAPRGPNGKANYEAARKLAAAAD